MAMLDNDEYVIDSFLGYKGEPLERSKMDFLVRFADKTEVWLPWSKDLSNTVQFVQFKQRRAHVFIFWHPLKPGYLYNTTNEILDAIILV
jgi:hypothetical protein